MMKKNRHPLFISFNEYISTLSENEKRLRLGHERYEYYSNGEKLDEYCNPLKKERFEMNDMEKDDDNSFDDFYRCILDESSED